MPGNRLIHRDFVVKNSVRLTLACCGYPGVSFEVEVESFCSTIEGDVSAPERFSRNLEYFIQLCVAEVLKVPADPFHLPPMIRSLLAHLNDAVFPIPGLGELGQDGLDSCA